MTGAFFSKSMLRRVATHYGLPLPGELEAANGEIEELKLKNAIAYEALRAIRRIATEGEGKGLSPASVIAILSLVEAILEGRHAEGPGARERAEERGSSSEPAQGKTDRDAG